MRSLLILQLMEEEFMEEEFKAQTSLRSYSEDVAEPEYEVMEDSPRATS